MGIQVEVEGMVPVSGKIVTRIVTVPGVGTGAHASGDVGGIAFPLAELVRADGAGGIVESVVLVETTTNGAATELWLFDKEITAAVDDAAHSISDGHAEWCVGVVPITSHYASALNSTSVARGVGLAFNCESGRRDLVGLLVTRGTPTYAANGVKLKVTVIQE